MASRFPLELELTISSAKDLKNVNWRYGDLKPYVVAWVDPDSKLTTKVDNQNDTSPVWNEKLTVPVRSSCLEDAILSIEVVHANASGETKPLIGSARLPLDEIVEEVGFDERYTKSLKLKRPSGRPQGKLEVKATVREIRYPAPSPYPQPYGQTARDYQPAYPYTGSSPYGAPYGAPPAPYGAPYGAPPAPYGAPPAGYPGAYGGYGYNAPQQQYSSGYDSGYGSGAAAPAASATAKKGSKFGGVGTGLAVGAVAGVLGGLALAGGANYVEDKIADKVEDDFGGGGDGDYEDDY